MARRKGDILATLSGSKWGSIPFAEVEAIAKGRSHQRRLSMRVMSPLLWLALSTSLSAQTPETEIPFQKFVLPKTICIW